MKKRYKIQWIIFACFILLDQVTKKVAQSVLKGKQTVHLIPQFLGFQYLENRGAAFGILQGQKIFFIMITIIALILLGAFYREISEKSTEDSLHLACVCIAAGAIGNLIDRIIRGYVIDFLLLEWISFPIFNFADCYITIGSIWFLFYFLFQAHKTGKPKE